MDCASSGLVWGFCVLALYPVSAGTSGAREERKDLVSLVPTYVYDGLGVIETMCFVCMGDNKHLK